MRLYRTTRELAKALAALPPDQEPSLAALAALPTPNKRFNRITVFGFPHGRNLASQWGYAQPRRPEIKAPKEKWVGKLTDTDFIDKELLN